MELFNSPLFSEASLKAYYRFTGNSLDETANNHDGTDVNATYGIAYGKYGQGVTAPTGNIYITEHADFEPTTNFSLGGWFKTGAAGGSFFHNSFRDAGGQQEGWKCYASTNFAIQIGTTGAQDSNITNPAYAITSTSDAVVNTQLWVHGVATYDGSNIRLYINGKLDKTTACTLAPTYYAGSIVRIGAETYQPATNHILAIFDGSIDDVFFFNGKVLNAIEVAQIYQDAGGAFLLHFC